MGANEFAHWVAIALEYFWLGDGARPNDPAASHSYPRPGLVSNLVEFSPLSVLVGSRYCK